jgi:exopolyphosphatase/pppGpp-phosphohydrolase
MLQATLRNIRQTPASIAKSVHMLRTGEARANLANMFQTLGGFAERHTPQAAALAEKKPFSDLPLLDQPVAVVDVGSNQLKTLIRLPDGSVLDEKFPVSLGESLGKHGKITPEARRELGAAWRQSQALLKQHGVTAERTEAVATEGLRAAGAQGKEIAQRLGLRIIDGREEGRYIYQSVMRGQHPAHGKGMVIEIGGGSTEWAFAEDRFNRMMSLGTGRNAPADPFDPQAIAAVRQTIRSEVRAAVNDDIRAAAKGHEVFIAPEKKLRKIHLALTGKDLKTEPLTLDEIHDYLSPEGLARFRGAKGDQARIQILPTKLAILAESMDELGLKTVRFGSPGGMKAGVMQDVILKFHPEAAREIRMNAASRELRPVGENLARRYQEQFADALAQMEEILGGQGHTSYRAKSGSSIADKLAKKAVDKGHVYSDTASALSDIEDAIGTRLVVPTGSSAEMGRVAKVLADAVRDGKLEIMEINNYRGADGLPYFSDEQVQALVKAAGTAKRKGLSKAGSDAMIVNSGEKITKSSGYTTTQMYIRYRNGALGELQIRGPQIDRFAEVEHIIYDMRQGKAFVGDLPPALEQDVESLRTTLKSLSREQFSAYLTYIGDTYKWYRMMENGSAAAPVPVLPKSLRAFSNLELSHIDGLHERLLGVKNLQKVSRYLPLQAGGLVTVGNPFFKREA